VLDEITEVDAEPRHCVKRLEVSVLPRSLAVAPSRWIETRREETHKVDLVVGQGDLAEAYEIEPFVRCEVPAPEGGVVEVEVVDVDPRFRPRRREVDTPGDNGSEEAEAARRRLRAPHRSTGTVS
jgi:hypothetical protein